MAAHWAGAESVADTAGGASRGSNQTGVRAYNERLVMSLVRRHGELAKANFPLLPALGFRTDSAVTGSL